MKTFEKIRLLREQQQWTQEEMAGKLNLSLNGYAKIERGETRLNLPRLEQIAEVFEMDIMELMQPETTWNYQVGDNNSEISFYNAPVSDCTAEIEKLRLIIQHKDELLNQQANELQSLREIIALLKSSLKSE
ncbi:helix-turn-helix domain-containing protein [Wielerella bovis]|uniref:helix-turn-helix domain-containing protein n=1 Tax=Wielerella bovis TaxID=2917790 RepID=UPI002019E6D5|nr:helix-turn-helix transcriptional regulator [Wielerella bovis]ULJ60607.1 helix-turn-helix domain-containing protein [Wielerella bovis]ULJ62820.1 helix-turn-helix domain-containing protein [Wielerella bovis]